MKLKFYLRSVFFSTLFFLFTTLSIGQSSWLVGMADPNLGTSANYTTHNHLNIFDVLVPDGIILDSISIYPATASSSYTIIVQNSAQTVIASYTGTTTVGNHAMERVKTNLFIPMGTGYRIGLASGSVGMLRNSSGAVFPYTVPNVISFTGATYSTTYWYYTYNIRVKLSVENTDAGLTAIIAPSDTICSGTIPVEVTLKNHGPKELKFVKIDWKVNNVAQPQFLWSGSLAANNTTNVVLGNYPFHHDTIYQIVAYTTEPNGFTDTATYNDTITKQGIYVKTSPLASFSSTTKTICQGDSVELTGTFDHGSPPFDIKIAHGSSVTTLNNISATNFSFWGTPTANTFYTIKEISDASGCTTIDPGDSIEVLVTQAPPAAITVTGLKEVCFGDSVMMMASVGVNFTYQWYQNGNLIPGATGYVYGAKEGGNYTVEVTSPNGCKNTSDPVLITVFPAPQVNLGKDTALTPDKSIKLDAGSGYTSYVWSTGESTQQIIVDSTGIGIGVKTIWVLVTDDKGCQGGDTIKINFTNNPGIASVGKISELKISPNPTTGRIEIQLPGYNTGLCKFELFTIDGKKLAKMEQQTATNQKAVALDLSEYSNGRYILKTITGNNVYVNNIILRKM